MAAHLLCARADAVKFADGTDVEVSVRCEPAAHDADCDAAQYELTLVVSDSGRGMSADECTRVFAPYYRSPSHRGGGTGLGARCPLARRAQCADALSASAQACTFAPALWKVRYFAAAAARLPLIPLLLN
jgi:hypothetical protein